MLTSSTLALSSACKSHNFESQIAATRSESQSCTFWVVRRRKEESQMLLAYLFAQTDVPEIQVILPPAPVVSNEGRSSPLLALALLSLGPGFRLGARWNRLAVKTRKRREKTGGKWARYGLRSVKEGS